MEGRLLMIKIHLSGTKDELKEFTDNMEEISLIQNISPLKKNSNNKFFSQDLEIISKKIIRIPKEHRSKYEG